MCVLRYEIDTFETPTHLMQLSQKPEYAHLKHPYTKDLIVIPSSVSFPSGDYDEFF